MTSFASCRGCGAPLEDVFCDLGVSPLANSYVRVEDACAMEPFFPLKVLVCGWCMLVQLDEFASPEEIFSDYAYFSSWSTSWVEHARRFATEAIRRFGLGSSHLVVELASNDGYLLRWFQDAGIPVLGVEPAANVAAMAIERGIETVTEFFGTEIGVQLAASQPADLIVANNVLAHVPDLHDFVGGITALLAPGGRATIEFPHLLNLMREVQFDTIYHEHFSYLSLQALDPVFADHDLEAIDVERLDTHGGSLRLYVGHRGAGEYDGRQRVEALRKEERSAGLDDLAAYRAFGPKVAAHKRAILAFLLGLKEEGASIAGYGAPAKGNTMLNYCGIGTDVIDFTVDANPAKQGTLLPGSRIPVLHPDALVDRHPDVVLLLPWNLRRELVDLLAPVRSWGGQLAVCQPAPAFLK